MSRMSKKDRIPQQPVEAAAEETPVTDETVQAAEEAAVDAEQLQKDLDAATAKAEEYLNLAQRVQADFDNFRRRNESVRTDAFADGQQAVASAMLPVLDNLERALDAAGADDALKSGVELVLRQMRDVYAKFGVTPIDRLGEKFDPNLENAIMQGAPEDGDPGTVRWASMCFATPW